MKYIISIIRSLFWSQQTTKQQERENEGEQLDGRRENVFRDSPTTHTNSVLEERDCRQFQARNGIWPRFDLLIGTLHFSLTHSRVLRFKVDSCSHYFHSSSPSYPLHTQLSAWALHVTANSLEKGEEEEKKALNSLLSSSTDPALTYQKSSSEITWTLTVGGWEWAESFCLVAHKSHKLSRTMRA